MQVQTKDKPIVEVIETSITSEDMKILLSGEILLKKIKNVLNDKIQSMCQGHQSLHLGLKTVKIVKLGFHPVMLKYA